MFSLWTLTRVCRRGVCLRSAIGRKVQPQYSSSSASTRPSAHRITLEVFSFFLFACHFSGVFEQPTRIDPSLEPSGFDRLRLLPEPKLTGLISDSLPAFPLQDGCGGSFLPPEHSGSILRLGSNWLILSDDIMSVSGAKALVFCVDLYLSVKNNEILFET